MLKSIIRGAFALSNLDVSRRPKPLLEYPKATIEPAFDLILCHYLVHSQQPYFLQIGAFNGIDGDPLHQYVKKGLLKGCLVEPQPEPFEQLRLNYTGVEGLAFRRAAIGPRSGTQTMWRVRPGTVGPSWLHQIASFRREVLLEHSNDIPGLEDAIVGEEVPTITFDELYADLWTVPDIVVIDTEGYDYEIIKLLNLPVRKPRIIHYEHKHLSIVDRDALLRLLISHEYRIAVKGYDTTAYLPPTRV